MARTAHKTPVVEDHFTEKDFYLDEFRGHTLVVAIPAAQLAGKNALSRLAGVARALLPNGTRLVILLDAEDSTRASQVLRSLQRRLLPLVFDESDLLPLAALRAPHGEAGAFSVLPPDDGAYTLANLTRIWIALRRLPIFVGVIPEGTGRLAHYAQELARRLRVHKLVLVEPEGGVSDATGSQMSFMDAAMLAALLATGEAEWAGVAHRRATLDAVRRALVGGVAAVNLCTLDGLGRELFTYEGSGTLFTYEDYCRIAPLGIDDFEEVERLIERGQREGFLKVRTPEEIAEIVLCGYGATIGAHQLAGICALYAEPYRAECAGEVVALYTLTRFKGEGIGRKLLVHLEAEARRQELRYLFAVTSETRAQSLFLRNGYRRVGAEEVPVAKWAHYDAARRAQVAVFRLDLRESVKA